jgi:hypothetical protein
LPDRDVEFLASIVARAPFLGARDRLTASILSRSRLAPVRVGGDPAWYDLDRLDEPLIAPAIVRAVTFTPPANPVYEEQAADVLRSLHGRHPDAEITVVEHRDERIGLARAAAAVGAGFLDASGSALGMGLHDHADIHVGYRVHAHLYRLSRGQPSYLIAEDSRGRGALDMLGLLGALGFRDRGRGRVAGLWMRVALRAATRAWPAQDAIVSAASRYVAERAISDELSSQVSGDLLADFGRHRAAREVIRQTLPEMRNMIETIT